MLKIRGQKKSEKLEFGEGVSSINWIDFLGIKQRQIKTVKN